MIKSKYACSQAELYTVAKLGWQSCKANITKFTHFKAKYTEAYIQERNAEIVKAAEHLDNQARSEKAETLRENLVEQGIKCLSSWQKLKRYIADSFPKSNQKAKLEAAGIKNYSKAAQNNWDYLKTLMQSGSNFIKEYVTELKANQNMPPTFQANFDNVKATFDTLHQDFLKTEENNFILTQAKITANNEIHTKLMSMFMDAKEIFDENDALLKQFVFTDIQSLISGAGTAGIKGIVLDELTNQPIPNVSVSIPIKNKTTLTDAFGKYELIQIAVGEYLITFEKEGYLTKTSEKFEIKLRTVSKLDIKLKK